MRLLLIILVIFWRRESLIGDGLDNDGKREVPLGEAAWAEEEVWGEGTVDPALTFFDELILNFLALLCDSARGWLWIALITVGALGLGAVEEDAGAGSVETSTWRGA